MNDLFDKNKIWAFDDLTHEKQKEAEYEGFEPGRRYPVDIDPYNTPVAECPFCHRSAIDIEDWLIVCPHFVLFSSCYNGIEYVREDFANALWKAADLQKLKKLGIDQDLIDDLIEKNSVPHPEDLEALGIIQSDSFDFGIDNHVTYGFASDEFFAKANIPHQIP